jgi:hypothetical protein
LDFKRVRESGFDQTLTDSLPKREATTVGEFEWTDGLYQRHLEWLEAGDWIGLEDDASAEQWEQYYERRWTQILERWQP